MEAEPRPRVLVVDDEPFNLQVLERVFRRDFELVFATSGAEAIEALLRVDFDVALVDYVMPGMNGVELLRRIAELAPTVHRVLLTAYADMQEVKAAQESGLSMALVPKPWDRDQLFKLVTSLASLARVLRSARARLKDSSGP